mmetsp:Transcript_39171/g.75075  ORF Transcript_39171/g.75075 Transcript_39171/m.75075 type:complete len:305 (-) Transcript_39171:358-1272(-)
MKHVNRHDAVKGGVLVRQILRVCLNKLCRSSFVSPPELLPVLVVAARLGQVEGRQVGAHGAELGEAVFQEGVEAASAAPDLQHARRGLLPPLHELGEGHEGVALHGILPAHKKRLRAGLVHLGAFVAEPAVALVVEGVSEVARVHARVLVPNIRGGLGVPPLDGSHRLRDEALRLVQDVGRVELPMRRVHVVRGLVHPALNVAVVLAEHRHRLQHQPPRRGQRRAKVRASLAVLEEGAALQLCRKDAHSALHGKEGGAHQVVAPVGNVLRRSKLRLDVCHLFLELGRERVHLRVRALVCLPVSH